MALMTPQEARVIDPLLTNHARGFVPQGTTGHHLFPTVPVEQRGSKVMVFSRENMGVPASSTVRNPGDAVVQESYGYASDTVNLTDHGIDTLVPVELEQEAAAVPKLSLSMHHVGLMLQRMANQREIARATLATTAANYSVNNTTTLLSGTTSWAANGNPIEDMEEAKYTIAEGTGGVMPNTLLISPAVKRALRANTFVLDQIKYSGAAPLNVNVTEKMLAEMFEVDNVVSAGHYWDNAGTFEATWGADAVLAYVDPSSTKSRYNPSFGYNYLLSGYPRVGKGWYDSDVRSWKHPYDESQQEIITFQDAGYLFKDAGVA